MTIYVLAWGNLRDGEVVGVFSSYEKADTYRLKLAMSHELLIDEYELDVLESLT